MQTMELIPGNASAEMFNIPGCNIQCLNQISFIPHIPGKNDPPVAFCPKHIRVHGSEQRNDLISGNIVAGEIVCNHLVILLESQADFQFIEHWA